MPPELREAYEQGRKQGLLEAVSLIKSLRRKFVPWLMRDIGDVGPTDKDGFAKFNYGERHLRDGIARLVERLVTGEKEPPCPHFWSEGAKPICARCGAYKQAADVERAGQVRRPS